MFPILPSWELKELQKVAGSRQKTVANPLTTTSSPTVEFPYVSPLERLRIAIEKDDKRRYQQEIERTNRVNRELVRMITDAFEFGVDPSKGDRDHIGTESYETKLIDFQLLLLNPKVEEIFDALETCGFEIKFEFRNKDWIQAYMYLQSTPRVFVIRHSIPELSSSKTLNDVKALINQYIADGTLPKIE